LDQAGEKSPTWLLITAAIFQQTLMAGTFIAARFALREIDPYVVAFVRFVAASVVLVAIARNFGKNNPISRADWYRIGLLGVLIILFNQTVYLVGQKYTTAAHGALLFATTPIFVYLIAMRVLGERWSRRKALGILLAVIGSGVIILENGFSLQDRALWGDVLILVAVIAWAFYSVFGKPLVHKYGAMRITAYSLALGTVVYFPYGLYRFLSTDLQEATMTNWYGVLYLAICTSVIGYFIWYWLMKYMEASRVAVITNLQPIIAGILGFYLLGEGLSMAFAVGGIIVLVGVTVTQKA
jgi:drug/metabolite transporter (DMT)-like permease